MIAARIDAHVEPDLDDASFEEQCCILERRWEAAEARADALVAQFADTSERLRKAEERSAALVEALRPFAAYSVATDPGDWADDSGEVAEEMRGGLRWSIKLGWLRRAARLAPAPNGEKGGADAANTGDGDGR